MIQRHGFRLSNDADIFVKDEDVVALYEADRMLLESEGLYVEKTKSFSGFVEAMVSSFEADEQGTTNLQWVAEGLNCFFPAIEDEEVGFRLHFADLAVNKLLACAGRKELRDFVDMWMIDAYSVPLWRVALAAPGKDARWSPESIIEKMAANMIFSPAQFESEVNLITEVSPQTILQGLMNSIDEARSILPEVNMFTAGQLGMLSGQVVNDRAVIDGLEWIGIKPGGNEQYHDVVDDNLTQPLIDKFGREGFEISDSLTFP